MTLQVTELPGARTSELRRAVLRPSWAPGTPMHGDTDPAAVHIGALDGADVVGACVLFRASCPHRPDVPDAWQLRGMATAEAHRGRGVGGAVLAAALDAVQARGARLVWCKARLVAVPFYARHGFELDSEDYVEPQTGLPHRDMARPVRSLP